MSKYTTPLVCLSFSVVRVCDVYAYVVYVCDVYVCDVYVCDVYVCRYCLTFDSINVISLADMNNETLTINSYLS